MASRSATAAAACVLTAALITPRAADAARHPSRPRAVCVPVYIEGAGTVRICAPARAR